MADKNLSACALAFERHALRYDEVVARLLELPTSIIHGEFFPSNILFQVGIIQAHQRGIVTTASLMRRGFAAACWRDHPERSVWIHIDLGEWAYRDGQWIPLYQVAPRMSRRLPRGRSLINSRPSSG